MDDEMPCIDNRCSRVDFYDFTEICQGLSSNDKLGILHLNIRSIKKNFSLFVSYLEQIAFKFHVIVLTETWLLEPKLNSYQLPNYNAYSTTSVGKRGGIRAFIRDNITAQPIDILHGDTFQSLNLTVKLPSLGNIFLGAIYKSPNTSNLNFNDDFERTYSERFHASQKVIYVGDFNLDLFQHENTQINKFLNIMRSFNCSPFITEATRDPPDSQSCTLIDHLWSNIVVPAESYVLECMITDHFPIVTYFSVPKLENFNATVTIKYRDFNEANLDKMFSDSPDLYYTQHDNVISSNVNNSLGMFSSWLNRTTNKYFPIKKKGFHVNRLMHHG